MARKLSRIARHGSTTLTTILWLTAATASAQDSHGDVHVSSPSGVVQNPFVERSESHAVAAPEEPDTRGATIYRNPFATRRSAPLKLAPPTALPARPGPLSRWQRSNLLADEPASVRSAILDTKGLQVDPLLSVELDPPDALGAKLGQPPDPIQFAPQELEQPAWLTGEADGAQPLSSASAKTDPITIDSFCMPSFTTLRKNQNAETNKNERRSDVTTHFTSPNWPPFIVSDYGDSPQKYYDEARQMADTAETVERLSAAIGVCDRGIAATPQLDLAVALRQLAAWAHNRRGELHADAQQRQEAFADFQAAISLDPTCWTALHNRAVMLAERGQLSAALRDFNRVLELDPTLAIAYRNRAELLASLGRMGEAVHDYSRALDQSPDDPELYLARGSAWQRLGDFDRALADLNKSLKLAPDQPDAYTLRGNLAAEQGHFDSAIANYQQALRIDPNWGDAHRSLAWLWATCPNQRYRRPEQALAAADEAMTLAPRDSVVLDAAAAAHANANQFDKAIELQQQAIDSAPPELVEQLRQRLVLYQQGQPFRSGQVTPVVEQASHTSPAARHPR
jgi:tetratricopeptide (TPR) repeat protein